MGRVKGATKMRDVVAVILAVGLVTSMNVFTFAVLYDAMFSDISGLSENATQILTGWGGGIIGILGSVFGFQAGQAAGGGRVISPEEVPALDEEDTPAYVPE
jgi:hypothetical protein